MSRESGVLLLLSGPLQSWGTDSRFEHRHTDFEPSRSGVLGLVGAALGMKRDDAATLSRLNGLSMAIRVDREGRITRDYHTAGGGSFRGKEHGVRGKGTVLSERFYLSDAVFVVALASTDSNLISAIAASFSHPRWPLFLGRRSCVPDRPVFLAGPREGDVNELLLGEAWQGQQSSSPLTSFARIPEKLRCVVDANLNGSQLEGRLRADIPLSFASHSRSFHTRRVVDIWIESRKLPGAPHVSEPTSA